VPLYQNHQKYLRNKPTFIPRLPLIPRSVTLTNSQTQEAGGSPRYFYALFQSEKRALTRKLSFFVGEKNPPKMIEIDMIL
jgi:hypothetical protein